MVVVCQEVIGLATVNLVHQTLARDVDSCIKLKNLVQEYMVKYCLVFCGCIDGHTLSTVSTYSLLYLLVPLPSDKSSKSQFSNRYLYP